LAAFFLLVVTILAVRGKQRRYLASAWFWFLGTLVPMIGLVQVGGQAMADRYAYLPYIGLFIMVCWVMPDSLPRSQACSRALAISGSLALLALAAVSVRQIGYWGDNVTLWTHTVEVTGPNFIAEDNLGLSLRTGGRIEDAIAHFRRAVEINPEDPIGNLNVAAYEQQHGNLQSAIRRYQVALRMTPSPDLQATAYSNLGSAYRALHDAARARQNYQAALDRMPQSAPAWVGLGLVEQDSGSFDRAIDDYSHAMSIQPTDVGYLLLAQALQKAGRNDEAKGAHANAQAMSADLAQAQQRANELLAP
jgi:tetratricopeptide (TPR) repeat protein